MFSGSIVVDHANTSGFGSADEPALVALYTSVDKDRPPGPVARLQHRPGAHVDSLRRQPGARHGIESDFRDPRSSGTPTGGYWVMVVMLAAERIVQFYRSDNLIDWAHLSDFGPLATRRRRSGSARTCSSCPSTAAARRRRDGCWWSASTPAPQPADREPGTSSVTSTASASPPTPTPATTTLVGLRRGLLCAGLLQRHPGRRARPDRLDEQLGLRRARPRPRRSVGR